MTVISFDERNSADALHHALGSTEAKGLLLSPNSVVGGEKTRQDVVRELMVGGYPHL